MKRKPLPIPMILFIVITFFLTCFFVWYPPISYGGDIVEYFGMTQSFMNHGTFDLTSQDKEDLKRYLHEGYFVNPKTAKEKGGFLYYLDTTFGQYPVHFVAYSLLVVPFRIALGLAGLPEISALRLTNLFLLSLCVWLILKLFTKTTFQQYIFLACVYLSPILWFIIWPGPDMWYISLLLVAIFLFFHKHYEGSIFVTAIASWHSQPLIIIALAALFYYVYQSLRFPFVEGKRHVSIHSKNLIVSMAFLFSLSVPYLWNYALFGVLTPWTILQDGWTQLNGFGLQNISLQKLYEQFFDLNIGLFWYAPALLVLSTYLLIRVFTIHKSVLVVVTAVLATALFYQTNPAWHYGTSGYGPTRHILFVIPFLIYLISSFAHKNLLYKLFFAVILLVQIPILAMNGFLAPDFLNSLRHSPHAVFVLNNTPFLYNPTPEIFVDRTNHTDLKVIETAIYKENGTCKKAFVVITDKKRLSEECGFIPHQYQDLFDNQLLRKANFPRTIYTTPATLWPDINSCNPEYANNTNYPFVCMITIDDVAKLTGVSDKNRFSIIGNYPGVWRLLEGTPVKLTVPPGYIIDHHALEGTYVTY